MFIRTPWWHGADGAGLSYPGSHGSQNPDVRLWVTWEGSSYADLSSFATPGHPTNASYSTAGLQQYGTTHPVASPQQIEYYGTYATDWLNASGWTAEGFVTWIVTEDNTGPGNIFGYYARTPYSNYREHFLPYAEQGKVQYDNASFGTQAGPTATTPLAGAPVTKHWAWSVAAGSGVQRNYFYINGVNVMYYDMGRDDATGIIMGTGGFIIGGTCSTTGFGVTHLLDMTMGETRVVRRCLYPSGTSFTPPVPGGLSVIS